MELMLKNSPVLEISEDGVCKILDFDRLPFSLLLVWRRRGGKLC